MRYCTRLCRGNSRADRNNTNSALRTAGRIRYNTLHKDIDNRSSLGRHATTSRIVHSAIRGPSGRHLPRQNRWRSYGAPFRRGFRPLRGRQHGNRQHGSYRHESRRQSCRRVQPERDARRQAPPRTNKAATTSATARVIPRPTPFSSTFRASRLRALPADRLDGLWLCVAAHRSEQIVHSKIW